MLELYDHPLSPFSQKVKIALAEKGVAFETKMPEGIGVGGAGGTFAEANPRLEVPTLIHGATQVFDSTIILEYIDETWPDPVLLPDAPADRAKVRQIEDVLDTHFEAVVWGLGELRFFGRAQGELAERMETRAAEQIRGFHAWLDRQLGDGEWFNGDSFGRGDICVAPFVNGAAGFGHPVAGFPRLEAWFERINARPSVAAARDAALASMVAMQQVAEAIGSGEFKREYRDHRLEWIVKSGGLEIVERGLADETIRFTPDFR